MAHGKRIIFLRRAMFTVAVILTLCELVRPNTAGGQISSVGSTSFRPFVVSWTPVIGRNGAVGGVSIDSEGVVSRATPADTARLSEAWLKSATPIAGALNRPSRRRMVSLTRLETALTKRLDTDTLPDEMMLLAGLQRVDYVFVYPASREIVIAGPADGWHLDRRGVFVGNGSQQPVLRLDDLIDAFRNAAARRIEPISCSIDPTPDGLVRLQQLLSSRRLQFNPRMVEQMQEALGPHQIRVTGVPPDSHFSQVMVRADYMLKRLAMGLDESPVDRLPSYMQMLKSRSGRSGRVDSPRWWLAVDAGPLRHSPDRLAWQLAQIRVKAMTEDGYLDAAGRNVDTGRTSPPAAQWAAAMTAAYGELSQSIPAFAELRDCMDLAIVAALVNKHELAGMAGCSPPITAALANRRGPRLAVPKQVDTQASLIRGRRGWIVSVSGGIDLDPWAPLETVTEDPKLIPVRTSSAGTGRTWWWDAEPERE